VAKQYRLSPVTRLINAVFRVMTRLGVGAAYRHILTVPGRKTGQLRSTPVDVMEVGGHRWLVAGYGPANWVLNARAAGEVTLSRGRRTERYAVADASPGEAVPVLRKYIAEVRVTRPYFDAAPNAPDDALEGELGRHPVIRLIPQTHSEDGPGEPRAERRPGKG
jgi:deazaflavin-dependent oxidoreductase (nitroreductase family)